MKSKIYLLFGLFLLIINLNFISACISFPIIETKSKSCDQQMISSYNESEIREELIYYRCFNNENDSNINTVIDFIKNGYSVKEQTNEEYQLFLNNAKKKNKGWWCGDIYSAVSRKGDFTGYIMGKKERMIFWIPCPKAQLFKGCSGGPYNIVWNDLKK